MNDYNGNRIPYLYVLFDQSDREQVLPVLEAMDGRGIRFCGIEKENRKAVRKALAVLAFLSEKFVQDEHQQAAFFAAKDTGVPMIPILLGDFQLPEIMQQAMYAKNSLMAARYPTPKALANRILTAEVFANPTVTPAQKRASRLGLAGAVACAAAVLLLAVFAMRPKQEAVPAPTEVVPEYYNPFGMTQADLEAIRYAVIIGDHYRFITPDDMYQSPCFTTCNDLGHREWHEDGARWYWNEDGSEANLTEYDLSFLQLFPNLISLQMAMVQVDALPDLSSLTNLRELHLYDCTLKDISGLAGTPLAEFLSESTPIQDCSPLTDCPKIQNVIINLADGQNPDFSGFAPESLLHLEVNGSGTPFIFQPEHFQQCVKLRDLRLTNCGNQGLEVLSGLASLQRLYLQSMPQLWDVSAIGSLRNLESLEIWDSSSLYNVSPIGQCTGLRTLQLVGIPASDVRFMDNLIYLTEIGLHAQQTNLDFLRCLKNKSGVNLYFSGPIQDFSALASINSFNYLHVNLWNRSYHELVEPYLENCTVNNTLNLYDCRDVRLEHLPHIYRELYIQYGDLQNLEGIPENISYLRLETMQQLTSLSGLENVNRLLSLTVNGCLRLKDWTALNGQSLIELAVGGMINLPDFDRFTIRGSLTLDSIPELTDLNCLADMPNKKLNLSLPGMGKEADLSALNTMEGFILAVSPEQEIPAMKLVEDGNFQRYEIVFPEGDWRNDLRFSLESMEDLENLPEAILKQATRLYIVGDTVYDPDVYEVWSDWDGNKQVPFLHNRETGEALRVKYGSFNDAAKLEKMTGLQELALMYQPLDNIQWVRGMDSLRWLSVNFCENLTDISPAFTMDGMEWLEFEGTQVASIQGIENLHRLRGLGMSRSKVADLSPLNRLDKTYSLQNGGMYLWCDDISAEDFSPLCSVPKYEWLCCNGLSIDAVSFFPMMAQSEVDGIAVNWLGSQEGFQAMLNALPGLRRIYMHGNWAVKDLSPLLSMSALEEVYVSQDMRTQAEQLRAQNPHFTITVE